ncbi:MAG: Asp-tRNA(Asn)/Glu-tRNA(Gln) amidotransferase subunit GatA, partial [Pseudomonadota bacterium]
MTNHTPPLSQDLHDLTVHQLALAVKARQVSSVELATHFLNRSRAHAGLGAYVDIQEELTLAQARAADVRIAQGTAGPLEGVPIAHKDIFVTRDFVS